MAVPFALLAGIGTQAIGSEANRTATTEGVKDALEAQRQGQAFSEGVLDQSIARQQPFIQAGTAALPLATLAAQGGEGFRDTGIFKARQNIGLSELLNSIQGDELSGFARNRFEGTLAGSEEAQNRARLNDLLSIGLGSSGTAGQAGQTLADLASRGAIQSGNLAASGAQTAFEQRQNTLNQSLEQLGGLPSFFQATR